MADAINDPKVCPSQYIGNFFKGSLPAATIANEIAGFMWPPIKENTNICK